MANKPPFDGEWVRLGELISPAKVERCGVRSYPILSITKNDGIIFQDTKFSKRIASTDVTNYKVVPRGKLVQGIHIDEANFGIQNLVDFGIVSPAYKVWNINDRLVLPDYLATVLRSPVSIAYYKANLSGTVHRRGRMSDATFYELPIKLPSLKTQQQILDSLDEVEALSTACQTRFSLLDTLVKSRFVEMFGDAAYPIKRLDEVAAVQGGLTKNTKRERLPFKLPYLRVANVLSGKLDLSEMKEIGLSETEKEKVLLEVGDLLFVEGNGSGDQIGRAAIWNGEIEPCVHQNHLIRARCSGQAIPVYVLHYFMSPGGREQIATKAVSTSGLFTLSTGKIKSFELPLPPLPLQREFADFVAQVDKSRFIATCLEERYNALLISRRALWHGMRRAVGMNFDFLKRADGYYSLFADACIEAEKVFAASPAMCAVGCRKALELAVKWVYAIDDSITMPYRDNLASLLHERSFMNAVDERVWRKLIGINKLGNLSVHTERTVTPADAILVLRSLFEFTDWIDYCYGPDYTERTFDERKIPKKGIQLTAAQIKTIKDRESLIAKQDEEIKRLEAKLKEMSAQASQAKEEHKRQRDFNPEDISEFETRKHYIDWDLALAGWKLDDNALQEREVHGMPVEPGNDTGTGYVDYLLIGKDGKPLAIVEAKKTTYSEQKGLKQARLYADCLEREFGYRPPIFLTNGFTTRFVDDKNGAPRQVSGIFSQDDLQKLLNRRTSSVKPTTLSVNEAIAGGGKRYYQVEAVQRVCANIESGHRKSLLVMATGTGKTRVSAALVDVLMRSGHVKNVLFLADRVALVRQAKHGYQNYLPNASLCNLCSNKDERSARIVFSTYSTIMNAIDKERNEDGDRLFTPAHFDLIVVDEAHRSIFKKYRAIFDYFDSLVVGLTATPANEVDRNTYDFFSVERGVPTYVYEYKTATEVDHVLVPYFGIETHTDFIDEGITYDDLPVEEREQLEDDFEETGQDVPDKIDASEINRWVFNEKTVDNVLVTLMEKGIHTQGGQELGKSVIFAQNQKHARYIVERFGKLYPNLPGDYIQAVVHSDDYSHTIIEDFELKPRPAIAVSVDMMDTGVDVPKIVNLVFFKKVRSKIKFWQMIGRGTRLCQGLDVMDPLDGPHQDKERFFIFDWCRNFSFFQENPKVVEGKLTVTVAEQIFSRQAELAAILQESAFAGEDYQSWRKELVQTMRSQVIALNDNLFTVRQHRREVEIYRRAESYTMLSAVALAELKNPISMLIVNDEADFDALRFDNIMYGYMVALCNTQKTEPYKKRLVKMARCLTSLATVPQVKEQMSLIERVADEEMLNDVDLLELENIRKRLRSLITFIVSGPQRRDVITHLDDPVTQITYGVAADIGEDFEDYKLKVERYLKDYGDSLVIQKLRTNKPMTEFEFNQLERIFTQELGNAEDYARNYGDTPFGLLVRKLEHLDRDAAMEAFAGFLNDQSLNEQQISFIRRVVDYVVDNGYMEPKVLNQPPFDRPRSFMQIFNSQQQMALVTVIKSIKQNAESPAA